MGTASLFRGCTDRGYRGAVLTAEETVKALQSPRCAKKAPSEVVNGQAYSLLKPGNSMDEVQIVRPTPLRFNMLMGLGMLSFLMVWNGQTHAEVANVLMTLGLITYTVAMLTLTLNSASPINSEELDGGEGVPVKVAISFGKRQTSTSIGWLSLKDGLLCFAGERFDFALAANDFGPPKTTGRGDMRSKIDLTLLKNVSPFESQIEVRSLNKSYDPAFLEMIEKWPQQDAESLLPSLRVLLESPPTRDPRYWLDGMIVPSLMYGGIGVFVAFTMLSAETNLVFKYLIVIAMTAAWPAFYLFLGSDGVRNAPELKEKIDRSIQRLQEGQS